MKVGILATKGADIIEFRYKPADLDALWHSPQGLYRAGFQVPTRARDNGSFLDFYEGGWQEILPNPGNAVSHMGAELGQHGETALLPWDTQVLKDDPDSVSVEFSIRTVRMPFELSRQIHLGKEDHHIHIWERLTNRGSQSLSFGWGHHPCFGEPFLAPGCEIDLPPARVHTLTPGPHSRYAAAQSSHQREVESVRGSRIRVDRVPDRSEKSEDVIYFSELEQGWYALRNPSLELGFALQWDAGLFPYLWSWQVYGGSFNYPYYGEAYTLGLEPFSCPPMNLLECLERKECTTLEAKGSIETELFAGFFRQNQKVKQIEGKFNLNFA